MVTEQPCSVLMRKLPVFVSGRLAGKPCVSWPHYISSAGTAMLELLQQASMQQSHYTCHNRAADHICRNHNRKHTPVVLMHVTLSCSTAVVGSCTKVATWPVEMLHAHTCMADTTTDAESSQVAIQDTTTSDHTGKQSLMFPFCGSIV